MWFCGFVCKSISNKKLHFHQKNINFFSWIKCVDTIDFFLNEKCKKSKLILISSKCLNWFTFVFLLIFGFWCKNAKKKIKSSKKINFLYLLSYIYWRKDIDQKKENIDFNVFTHSYFWEEERMNEKRVNFNFCVENK